MPTIHVACAVEGAYDAHSAAMLHSLTTSARSPLHVHYLHGPGFPAESRDKIEAMLTAQDAALSFYEVHPDRVRGLPVVDQFTVAMWYRIFLPELVRSTDRILYLDVDTLAVDAIDPLWEMDLSGHYVGAVTNVFMPHHVHRPESLGLRLEDYFNSGVLLFNLDEMRRDACTEALRECATARGAELEWPDQDALNLVLGHRRLPLHPRWNAMNSLRYDWSNDVFGAEVVREARRAPAIRHFEGPDQNKPWHSGCSPDDRALYARHRRETPWPRVSLEGPRPSRLRRTANAVTARVLHRRREELGYDA